MDIHGVAWLTLAAVVLLLVGIDVAGHVRGSHEPTVRESAAWTAGYVCLAAVFGLGILAVYGGNYATQFYAGYVTEWSLSLDNLFVFMIIMNSFKVPRSCQQKALLCGIVLALLFRLIFILLGAALVERFSWMFFIFGAWLLWTAWSQVRHPAVSDTVDDGDAGMRSEPVLVKFIRRVMPVTESFVGDHLVVRKSGRIHLTPLMLTVGTLGAADLMFAFDSIPAVFGLTREGFLVFACNAFALLGLRQLFFLVDSLLAHIHYLNAGLAVILGFIGIKLILQALAENHLPFINGGHAIPVPEVGTMLSMTVIIGTLIATVAASAHRSTGAQRGDELTV